MSPDEDLARRFRSTLSPARLVAEGQTASIVVCSFHHEAALFAKPDRIDPPATNSHSSPGVR
jgi:hypothetical protein